MQQMLEKALTKFLPESLKVRVEPSRGERTMTSYDKAGKRISCHWALLSARHWLLSRVSAHDLAAGQVYDPRNQRATGGSVTWLEQDHTSREWQCWDWKALWPLLCDDPTPFPCAHLRNMSDIKGSVSRIAKLTETNTLMRKWLFLTNQVSGERLTIMLLLESS